jgi:GNAT superfamily N-acetyltransferase
VTQGDSPAGGAAPAAVVIGDATDGFGAWLEAELLATLRADLAQAENRRVALAATLPDGRVAGGLAASTAYGWLHVEILWISPGHRGTGLGRALMAEAEARGRAIGCHAAWLDTSSPAARAFYERLGYAPFGVLENAPGERPETHRRWFMKKALRPG